MLGISFPLLFLSLVLFVPQFAPTQCMQLEIQYGTKKCFTEQVPRGANIFAEFNIASGATPMALDLFVHNERGGLIAHETSVSHYKLTIPSHHHARSLADEHGPPFEIFRFCLLHHLHPNDPRLSGYRRVFFDIKNDGLLLNQKHLVFTHDTDDTSRKIRELEESLKNVLFRLDDLNIQEGNLSQANDTTSSHVVLVSSLTSVVILAVGLIQFDFIKGTLKSSKVIS